MIKHTVFFTSGRLLKLGLGFVASMCVARYLGPTEFGKMNFAISYGSIFLVISNVGLSQIVLRELSREGVDKPLIMGAAMIIQLVASVICLGALLSVTYLDPNFTAETRLMALCFGVSFFFRAAEFYSSSLQSELKGSVVAYAELAQSLLSLGLKLLLIFCHMSTTWFVCVNALEWAIIGAGLCLFGKSLPRISFRGDLLVYCKALIKDSYFYAFAGLSTIIYQRIDQIMINNMLGPEEVGYYASGVRLTTLTTVVPTLIGTALFPVLVKKTQSAEQKNRALQKYFDIVLWSGIPISFIILYGAGFFTRLFYGEAYLAAVPALQIMAWKGLTRGIDATFARWMLLENKQKYLPGRQFAGCILNILLNLALIPVMGIKGAALATLLSILAIIILTAMIPALRPCLVFQIRSLSGGLPRLIRLGFSMTKYRNRSGRHDE